MKKLYLFLFSALCGMSANAVILQTGGAAETLAVISETDTYVVPPAVTASFNEDSTSITIHVTIPEIQIIPAEGTENNGFLWNVPGLHASISEGTAALPETTSAILLPAGSQNISLTENMTLWQAIKGYRPMPAEPPRLASAPISAQKTNLK